MTYSLPFGLTQKPTNHYFENGVIKFSCKEGELFFTAKQITREFNGTLFTKKVQSKEHLNQILKIRNLHEIPLLEMVQ